MVPRTRLLLTQTLTVIALLLFAFAIARRFTRFPGFEHYGPVWHIWTGHESIRIRRYGNDFDLIWDVDYITLITIAAAWPALQLAKAAIAAERRRRAAPQFPHCTQCGYDLRATPGRCPECGQVTTGPTRESLER
jgi:hypothetical protein